MDDRRYQGKYEYQTPVKWCPGLPLDLSLEGFFGEGFHV